MKTKIMNYVVTIKHDKRTGTDEPAYSSYVSDLGIAADGDSIEEAIKNTKKLMTFHLECLNKEEQLSESSAESFKQVRYA